MLVFRNLKSFGIEIRNASATPSQSNQLRNVNTIRWESWNISTQPGEIDDRKSEDIAFVVNAGMNITANNIYIQIKERSFFVLGICFVQLKFRWIYIRNMFLKFRISNVEYIVKISRGVVKHVYYISD